MSLPVRECTSLPVRECTSCGQYDDHPRHVEVDARGQETMRHMDCCAAEGCGICVKQIAGAAGAQGNALRDHLITKDGA